MEETTRYTTCKKGTPFNLSVEDLKIFLGILIFSGYHTLPSERDYWSDQEDLGVPLVRDAMSRNTSLEKISVIHFQNNAKVKDNKNDRSFKIRPLIDMVNANFRKWKILHKNLSVDGMIIRYYGHHPLKQFIRSKPIRFGYNLWALSGENGYCYNFSLYCGKESENIKNAPLGTRVVNQMLSIVDDPSSHVIYFDNFFTSFALLDKLRGKGIRATGTIRENRMGKCTLMSAEELEKFPRGYNDYKFESNNEIFIVRWKDNKCVAVATNFDTLEPTVQVMRWCKEKSAKAFVPRPALINNYNKYMGGVDMHDWLLEKHAIAIKGKKWYWSVFTRILDMSIVNAYLLYRDIHGKQSISIKDFSRAITVPYLKLGYGKRVQRGRPLSFLLTSRATKSDDIRYYGKEHMNEKRDKQRIGIRRHITPMFLQPYLLSPTPKASNLTFSLIKGESRERDEGKAKMQSFKKLCPSLLLQMNASGGKQIYGLTAEEWRKANHCLPASSTKLDGSWIEEIKK
ncbi:hypothetical protein J437_LFUL004826 [Ladona fulva]|uniref:PiggyBac transposable element-derived protein domain-containing protein n=1 Tax=Ladona fulva TaxID=123851 RepID=A0A8K0K115_LADFU|nr:hypothetical protein J437_LFUL004826 [Ladona fulva]